MNYLLAMLIPLVLSILIWLFNRRSAVFMTGLTCAALFEVSALCVSMFTDGQIPPAAYAVTALLAIVMSCFSDKKIWKFASVLLIIIFALEVFVFNLKSFSDVHRKVTYSSSAISGITTLEEDSSDKFIFDSEGLVVYGDTYIVLTNVPEFARCVTIKTSRQQTDTNRAFLFTAELKDEAMSDSYMTVGQKQAFGYNGSVSFKIHPANDGFTLGIEINPATNENFAIDTESINAGYTTTPMVITGITIASAMPFDFILSRLILLSLLTVLIAAILNFKIYAVRYDRTNSYHRIVVELIVFACVAATFTVNGQDKNVVKYPLEESVDYYDIYVQVFDAFQKGQLAIDYPAEEGLAELENPYDYSQRKTAGLEDFLWDHAYYDGKYYSYFGISPIFTTYYPIYLLTGSVPTTDTAIAINGAFATLFICLAVLALIRRYSPDAKLLLVAVLLPTVSSLSYVPILMNYGLMYNVATISAIMFLACTFWSGFTATLTSGWKKYVLYFLSGISLALCAGARPIMAVGAAILLPAFFSVLADKKQKLGSRIAQALTFILPVIGGLIPFLWYNYARFGSILDFGSAYQLTVGDKRHTYLSPTLFPLAMYYFFLIPPQQTEYFPYFDLSHNIISNAESYRYTVLNLGALCFPVILLAVMFFVNTYRTHRLEYRATLFLSLVVPVITAWAVYCMAGACFRYSADIMFLLMLMTVLCLVECPSTYRRRYALTIVCCVISIAMIWALTIYFRGVALLPEGNNFRDNFPGAVEYIERLLIFWH